MNIFCYKFKKVFIHKIILYIIRPLKNTPINPIKNKNTIKKSINEIKTMSKSGFEPLTDGFSIQYSTPELLRQNTILLIIVKPL